MSDHDTSLFEHPDLSIDLSKCPIDTLLNLIPTGLPKSFSFETIRGPFMCFWGLLDKWGTFGQIGDFWTNWGLSGQFGGFLDNHDVFRRMRGLLDKSGTSGQFGGLLDNHGAFWKMRGLLDNFGAFWTIGGLLDNHTYVEPACTK